MDWTAILQFVLHPDQQLGRLLAHPLGRLIDRRRLQERGGFWGKVLRHDGCL